MVDTGDDALLDALGVDVPPVKFPTRPPPKDRTIAALGAILRFTQPHGGRPRMG